jgi:hypothetical protein
MLLAQEFAGATVQTLEPAQDGLLGAYAAEKNAKTMVALVNKSSTRDRDVLITSDKAFDRAAVWRLTGSGLDATTGVELGRDAVTRNGVWNPRSESLPVWEGALHVTVPAASAALIFLG